MNSAPEPDFQLRRRERGVRHARRGARPGRLRVVMPQFHLRTAGGVERYSWHVGAELAKSGHDVTFLAPPDGRALRPPLTKFLPLLGGGSGRAALGAALMTTALQASTRLRLDPNVVWYGPTGSHIRKPGVVTAHSVHKAWVEQRLASGGGRASFLDRVLVGLERMTYRVDGVAITAVSPLCADQLAEFYEIDETSVQVVPPALDTDSFSVLPESERCAARVAMEIDRSSFVIGTVANHSFEGKNVAGLMRACARIGSTLVVAGAPDHAIRDFRRLRAELGSDVRFLGLVEDMRAFYGALDAFALPSLLESYGMAAHEAMGCGVPTVVSDRCGIAGLLDADVHVLVVRAGDTEGLTEALASLRSVRLKDVLVARAVPWAHARTWADVGAEISAALEAVDQQMRA